MGNGKGIRQKRNLTRVRKICTKGENLKNMKNVIEIKKSLIKQLENKSANVDYFLGLIDDYIWYFEQEQEMQDDIKARGRHYKAKSASGYLIDKENESLKNAVTFNKQKLAILKQLGLTTDNVIDDADDEM